MAQKILLKRSTSAAATPTLEVGEIAVNLTDGKLFIGKSGGNLTFYDLVLLTSTFAKLASPAFTGNPTAPTQALSDSSTRIATTAFVKGVVDAAIAAGFSANDAMMFKGGVASNAGLPTTQFSAGWTYKVTAAGTYAGQACSVGDTIICIKDNQTATAISPTAEYWMVVQANVEAATASTLGLVKLATNPGLSLTAGALSVIFGTAANTVCKGNDSRLSNARTPVAHASTAMTYGLGTSAEYGHVKLSDAIEGGDFADAGEGASAYAVSALNTLMKNLMHNYGECQTVAATAAKVVEIPAFVLATGARVVVRFRYTNIASSPTLNVNSTGARPIFYRGFNISPSLIKIDHHYEFVYDGSNYEVVGDIDTDTTYGAATASTAGLMSAADKVKLNGVATGANNYSLPTAAVSTKGGIKVGAGLTMAGEVLNANVQSDNNFTSALKTKLDGIATGANKYSLPTAAASTKGGVKIGSRLSISSEVLSADLQSDNNFTNEYKAELDLLHENRLIFDASRLYASVTTLAGAIAAIPEAMKKRGLLLSFQDAGQQHLYQWNYPGPVDTSAGQEGKWLRLTNPDIDGGTY